MKSQKELKKIKKGGRPQSAENVLNKLKPNEIKEMIPELTYQGIFRAIYLLNKNLKGRDKEKALEAATYLMDKIGDDKFMRAISQLEEHGSAAEKSREDWGQRAAKGENLIDEKA